MRGRVERLARRLWAGRAGWPGRIAALGLAPAAGLYRVVLERRSRKDVRNARRVEGIPVISVGNLAVGGTGKTPVSAWLVDRLSAQGARPALVARGYGEDELLLHARWNPGAQVVAGVDRVAAVERAREGGATVAILDDGFQHRRLARDVDLVLLAAEDPFPGQLLPRGPYREPPEALERAHALVVTRRTAAPADAAVLAAELRRRYPGAEVGRLHLAPGGWTGLAGEPADPPEGEILAVAGIARPDAFAAAVEALRGETVEMMVFGDHHAYTASDVAQVRERAGGRTVVTTEKDAVKLMDHAGMLPAVSVLKQEIRWEEGMEGVCSLVEAALRPQEAP